MEHAKMAFLYTAGFLYLFWVMYIFIMGLYRAYLMNRLTPLMLALGSPFVLLGGLMDVFSNMTIASVLCLDVPREWLVTKRFEKYIRYSPTSTGLTLWRYRVAKWVCDNLLDPFDPDGNHCNDPDPATLKTVPIINALKE